MSIYFTNSIPNFVLVRGCKVEKLTDSEAFLALTDVDYYQDYDNNVVPCVIKPKVKVCIRHTSLIERLNTLFTKIDNSCLGFNPINFYIYGKEGEKEVSEIDREQLQVGDTIIACLVVPPARLPENGQWSSEEINNFPLYFVKVIL